MTAPKLAIAERVARLRALDADEAFRLLVLIDARTPRAVDAAIEYAEAAATVDAEITGAPEPVTGTCGALHGSLACSLGEGHDGDRATCLLPAGHDGPHEDEVGECGAREGRLACTLPPGHPGHHGVTTSEGEFMHRWPRASRSHLTSVSGDRRIQVGDIMRASYGALGGPAAEKEVTVAWVSDNGHRVRTTDGESYQVPQLVFTGRRADDSDVAAAGAR